MRPIKPIKILEAKGMRSIKLIKILKKKLSTKTGSIKTGVNKFFF